MPAKKKTTKRSSTTRNSSALSRLKLIHRIVTENILTSAVMVSLFLNVFFLTGVILFNTSDSFQTKVFNYTNNRYCVSMKDDVKKADFDVACRTGQFKPYYNKAVTDYRDLLKRQTN